MPVSATTIRRPGFLQVRIQSPELPSLTKTRRNRAVVRSRIEGAEFLGGFNGTTRMFSGFGDVWEDLAAGILAPLVKAGTERLVAEIEPKPERILPPPPPPTARVSLPATTIAAKGVFGDIPPLVLVAAVALPVLFLVLRR